MYLLHLMGQEHKQYTWNLIAKKLTGEATPEELRELEELLRQNPELHYPMQTISDLWNPSNPQEQHIAEEAFSRHLDRMQDLKIDYAQTPAAVLTLSVTADDTYPMPEQHRKSRRTILLAAAAIIAAIIITGLYTRHPSEPARIAAATPAETPTLAGNEIFTGNGSRTHLTLPDGTVVWLNAGSRINYEKNFGATDRSVSLTGEAFFDVAPNAGKPFVIHTARIDIRVLGTSFNVKSYPSDKTTETTLIHGSIEVSIHNRPSDKIVLKPNEKLVVNNEDSANLDKEIRRHARIENNSLVVISKPTYEQRSGAIIETSWVDNKLIFQDEEFKSLARSMERWYGVTIRFNTPEKEDLRFTGIFEKETILQALDALKLTANFNYSIEGNQITIQ
ncbi:MAG TPA: FecR family protein [Puia sp.]|nr:FecR family protein [Puia sp.]